MKKFIVFRQNKPIREGDEWLPDIEEIGVVRAVDYERAIDAARGLTQWPIVRIA